MTESRRVIVRKHETILIPDGMIGTPVEDVLSMPVDELPEAIRGALVYDIGGRRIIARQDEITVK